MTKELEQAIRHIKTRADAWAVKEIEHALEQEPCDNPDKCHECDKILTCNYYKGPCDAISGAKMSENPTD